MCGGFGGSPSNNDQGRIVRGGRGSNIAERRKSETAQKIQDTLAGFAGSVIGGPFGGFLAGEASKRANTTEINLRTGLGTASSAPSGLDRDTAGDKSRTLLASAGTPKERSAKIMADTQDKRKKAKSSVSARAGTILAGRKIAEDKLKTKLGQ